MSGSEYNELIDSLYRGHDVVFLHKGQHYFLEREDDCHNLYEVSEDLESANFVVRVDGKDLKERIDAFCTSKLFEGKSFNECYSAIDIVYVE